MQCKYASIDIGLKRIGVATSFLKDIVTPCTPILRKNRNQAAKEIDLFLKEWEINTLIVGYPTSSEDMKKRINHFITLLKFDGEIIFVEEDMSSIEAQESIKGIITHKRDGRIDSLAAKNILERYLQTD